MLPLRWTDEKSRVRALDAWLPGKTGSLRQVVAVNIERTWYAGDDCRYFWVSYNLAKVGVWPGTESDEWIEYIPPQDSCPCCGPDPTVSCGWCK